MAVTRTQFFDELGRLQGDLLAAGTATSGTTTTLLDTSSDSELSKSFGASFFDGSWVYVNAGTNVGIERYTGTSAFTSSSQTVTVPAFPNAIDNTSAYEIWKGPIGRLDRNRILDRVLTEKVARWVRVPLTLVFDGDMETSGASGWTASSGNLTVTKTTTAGNVPWGTQALSLVTNGSGANTYAESGSIDVTEGEPFYFFAWVRPDSAANVCTLVVRDESNSADITLSGTYSVNGADGNAWRMLHGSFTVPEGCRSVTVRLTEGTASSTSFWKDIQLRPTEWRRLPLPSWCDQERKFETLWVYPRSERAAFNRDGFETFPGGRPEFDLKDVAGATVTLPWYTSLPLYVSGYRYYEAMASDSSTIPDSIEEIVRAHVGREVLALKFRRKAMDRETYLADLDEWNRQVGRPAARRHQLGPRHQPFRFREL